MFHRHHRLYASLLLVADSVSGLIALYLGYYLRYHLVRFAPLEVRRFFNPELLPFREYLFYFLLFLPVWILILWATQRYPRVLGLDLRWQALRVLQFVVAVAIAMGFATYLFQLVISRTIFFLVLPITAIILLVTRLLFHGLLRSRNINEHNQVKILIVGTDEPARRIGRLLESYKRWGYHVVGYLTSQGQEEQEVPADLPVLGSLEDLASLLGKDVVADEIIFLGSHRRDLERFDEVVQLCEELGIRTRVAGDFFPNQIGRTSLEFLEGLPLITFSTVPDHSLSVAAKRVLDTLVAGFALVTLAPLMAAVGFVIKLTSPGPVFYRQIRCGLYGRKFRLIKFRTMIEGAEDKLWEIRHLNEMEGPVFKMRNDPRVTPVGRFLRKFSIDELPQLWNVILGEMSLVGPRAPLPDEVQHYATKQRRRLSVKPGITCLWQVSGRNDIDFDKWMELDLHYIDNWSFWLDIQIMLRTIPAVFTGRGAR